MNIVEDQQFKDWLIKSIEEREFHARTGVHCSDLIYCLNKQALRKSNPEPNTEKETLLFSIGWATQRWLTGADEDEPEVEVDGIIVTRDALYDDCPWELKCTYQSSNRPVEQNAHWIHQIMAQCYTSGRTTAYLSRFELMGDWIIKNGNRPTLHAFRLEFSQDELERNWRWLLERREEFLRVIQTGKLLPKVVALPAGGSYECERCHYKDICEGGTDDREELL